MAATVVKLAVIPAAMGLASFRVYAMSQDKTETVLLSPRELSIYAPDPPATHYMNEQPGALQNGLGVVRVGLQPYVTAVKNAYTSVKVGAETVYTAGHDTYEFLRDPSPGFMQRVGVITVSGLAGLILARKGSRLMRLGVPLGMATVGTSVCYPTQTVGVVKMTGQKMYAASQYTTSSMASIFKSKPKEVTPPTVSLEQAPQATIPEPEVSEAKPLLEAESSEPATPAVDKVSPTEPSSASGPVEGAPSAVEPAPQPTTEVAPAEGSIDTEPAAAEPEAVTVVEQEAVQTALVPAPAPPVEEAAASPAEEIPAPAPVEAVPAPPPAAEVIPLPPPAEETELPPPAPVEEEAAPSPPAPVEEAAPSPLAAEEAAPVSIEGVADPPPVAEETAPAPVDEAAPPATTEEPSVIVTKTAGKQKFAPDPKLIDLGQASPEDADLYSTRG
ncbi:MICOS complex subunit MIC27 isoform X1 [Salvelinus sp. IW2-2015]|uniref:MICOS complex subunit MIC27 isoform X1 n=2 Tax=Salvelinus sp. IW2-2015 TaxID=2691554 RepID=UPI000CDF8B57|nr:MICOS complex subunit MIC27 isoform X1 [Salvelinus alpinus]